MLDLFSIDQLRWEQGSGITVLIETRDEMISHLTNKLSQPAVV